VKESTHTTKTYHYGESVVLSEYSSQPPDGPGRAKIVTACPLYALARVQALVADETQLETQLFLWTKKCRNDVHQLFDSDLAQVAELLQGLQASDYIDSEWCENGRGALVACDAYRIRRREVALATGKPMTVEYFVKLAIGKTGQLVLMVSCHV
jgi:hypothetical protein